MSTFTRHFFVCVNNRSVDAGLQSCGEQGGEAVATALRVARQKHRLVESVFITDSLCLGPCPEAGATVVVYPEKVWYTGVTLDDVDEIVEKHMVGGEAVERLKHPAYSS